MFGFVRVQREVYNSTFLKKIYLEFEYSQIENLEKYVEQIGQIYSHKLPRIKFRNHNFPINHINKGLLYASNKKEFVLKSADSFVELTIREDKTSLQIEGKDYKCFEDNIKDVLSLIIETFRLFELNEINFCSLRKLNLIEFNFTDNESPNEIIELLLNKYVSYHDDAFQDKSKISHNIHNLEFADGDYRLVLKYGMSILPSIENIGQLIVDYKISVTREIKIAEIEDEIDLLNSELFNVFSWIFNDHAKNILNTQYENT